MLPEKNNKDEEVSAAQREAWRRGVLSWKLTTTQKELYDLFYNSKHKVMTWLLARRSGKSFTLSVLALEQCIRKPYSIVKFVSPTKTQINTNLRPIFREILKDCPDEIKPTYNQKEYIYFFPNGSEIQLSGTDGGHADKLRGGNSDIFIVDEAQGCSDLDNIVKSILLPTTLTTKGRGLLSGTPPETSEHDFLKFIEEAQTRGSFIKKTVDDNSLITKEELEELLVELGGRNSEKARRELWCEILKDSNTSVIPEFDTQLKSEIIKDWPKPPYFDAYEAMDTGGKDFTVVLYAYYDFRADKIIIEDESVIDFQDKDSNTKKLVEDIHKKEVDLWTNVISGEYRPPHMRVSDIDYIFLNEIRNQSKLIHKAEQVISFQIAKKDNRDAAINSVRIMLSTKKIIIHPRCITLIRHLDNGKWNKNKTELARSSDNGHYDALMALVYLVRHVAYGKNPYPPSFDYDTRSLFIRDGQAIHKKTNDTLEKYKIIFGIKPKGPR